MIKKRNRLDNIKRDTKRKSVMSRLSEENGSAVIELCFIAPILIGSILFAVSIFLIIMNKSIAMGTLYEMLYGKEMYIINYGENYEEAVKQNIEISMEKQMMLAENINAKIWENEKAGAVVHNLESFDKGEYKLSVNYENVCKGIIMIANSTLKDEYEAAEEIRDTSNNLRRWQIYGSDLSN